MSAYPSVSFEFFPPRDLTGSFRLWDALNALSCYDPAFVSVTYGASGSTRTLTHDVVKAIGDNIGLRVAAHLTCVDATRDETMRTVDEYERCGVRTVVALRGDPPAGKGRFVPMDEGYPDSSALITALADRGMDVICGAYPEPHPDGTGTASDIAWLRRKQDAGASRAITQFFFAPETYLRFRDGCADAGIGIPVIPGVMPVRSIEGAIKFAKRCGAAVPESVLDRFAGSGSGEDDLRIATDMAAEMCEDLIREGVDHIHFYTLNSPHLTASVCDRILNEASPARGDWPVQRREHSLETV